MTRLEWNEDTARRVWQEEALEKGKKEKTIEMIRNFLAVGTPMEFIIKATGWSEEEILKTAQVN